MVDLVVRVRCHTDPMKILDTLDSAQWSCDKNHTQVFAAVDNVRKVAEQLSRCRFFPIYNSKTHYGWGAGLWTLLVEAIEFAEETWKFSHFLSVDYDTLFLAKGVDQSMLDRITSESVGLVGAHILDHEHWRSVFQREKKQIERAIGVTIPKLYTPGEGLQGGAMLITRSLINELKRKEFFTGPARFAKKFTSITDDHLISLFCRYCNLDIQDAGPFCNAKWEATEDPRGLEKLGVRLFHPIKLKPKGCGDRTEWGIRNYFRTLRGQESVRFGLP